MKQLFFAAAAALSLTACASMGPPSQAQIQSADYGNPITQEQAEKRAKFALGLMLKDPESARWDCTPVYRGWLKSSVLDGGVFYAGYRLDCQVNAKNSYGGYTGAKPYMFMFHNMELVAGWDASGSVPNKIM